MPAPPSPVSPRVKSLFLSCALLVSSAAFAAEVDPKLERLVRESLPVCAGGQVTFADFPTKLPPRFKGVLVKVESENHRCDFQMGGVLAPSGSLYLGLPWTISNEEGKTAADRLKAFVWRNFQMNATPVIDPKVTADGLYKVTLLQATENGKLPLEGMLDSEGKTFFFGQFRSGDDIRTQRNKTFESVIGKSPAKGAANAAVTIVEFSDFECPSCRRSSGYVDPILTKHDGKVRYVRYDMPLDGHPWAFAAALAGRAIHRQKPDLFWEYKKQVYANQESLNSFTFWDWARGFAADHELDLAKYDADLQSDTLKEEILKGAGLALSNEVRSTPTYMVNGILVEAGVDGKDLAEYVEKLLK
jgi:protein-disulfide isomerase